MQAGLFAVIIGAHLYSLPRVPAVWVDEAPNASRALGFLQTGRAFGTLDSGIFDKFDGYWTYFPWLGTAIHALGVWAFGVNILSLRLVSLLFGIALLAIIYGIGCTLYTRKVAFIAVILLSLSASFVWASHLGRHDAIVAVFGYGALALYLTDRKSRFSSNSMLSGLVLGLALDVHFNAVIFIPALVGLLLLDFGWGLLRSGRFWSFAAGLGCGILFFVLMHLVRYPETYRAIFSIGNGSTRNPTLFTTDLATWRSAVSEGLKSIDSLLLPVVGMAVLVILVWGRGNRSDRTLLTMFALLLLGMIAIITYRPYYAILLSPLAYLLIARCLTELVNVGKLHSFSRLFTLVTFALACGLVLSSVTISSISMTQDLNSDYQDVVARLRYTIPPGSSVMASGNYWFGLQDTEFSGPVALSYYLRATPNSTVRDALRAVHPDFLILDKDTDRYLTDDPYVVAHPGVGTFLPKTYMMNLLSTQAHLVDSFDTASFGNVRIFKFDWLGEDPVGLPSSP